MSVTFRCAHCRSEWGFPDLTTAQARAENRGRCPRCRAEGKALAARVRGWPLWLLGLLVLAEGAALPAVYLIRG